MAMLLMIMTIMMFVRHNKNDNINQVSISNNLSFSWAMFLVEPRLQLAEGLELTSQLYTVVLE